MPEIKERNPEISPNTAENKAIIIDVGRENIGREPIPREIKTWMEKVEQASTLQPKSVNDADGQALLAPLTPEEPKIILPITKKTFIVGFKKTWLDASRWLSSFWLRFIKIKKGNVSFKPHDTD